MNHLKLHEAMKIICEHNARLKQARSGVMDKVRSHIQHEKDPSYDKISFITETVIKSIPEEGEKTDIFYISGLCDSMQSTGFMQQSYAELIKTYEPLFQVQLNADRFCRNHQWIMFDGPFSGLLAPETKTFKSILSNRLLKDSVNEGEHLKQRMCHFYNLLNNKDTTISIKESLSLLQQTAAWAVERKVNRQWLSSGVVRKSLDCELETGKWITRLYNLLPQSPL